MDRYTVSPLTPLHLAFAKDGSHARTVVEDGKILGIVLMRDILGHAAAGRDIRKMAVEDAMIKDVISIEQSHNNLQMAKLFTQHKMKSLVIRDTHGKFLCHKNAPEIIQSLPHSLLGYFQKLQTIMCHHPRHIDIQANMVDACDQWLLNRISCLVVCEHEKVVGMLSESDVMRWLLEGSPESNVADYASSPAITLSPEHTVQQAWQTMNEKQVMKLIITDNKHALLGLVTATDMIVALCQSLLDTFSCYQCPDDVDMLLEWHKGGMIMAVNEKVLQCFGMQADEMVGLHWQDGCSGKHQEALLQLKCGEEQDILWDLGGAALPFVATRDSEQPIMWWRLKLS